MANAVSAILVGVGGYGESYLHALDRKPGHYGVELVAGVEPFPAGAKYAPILAERGIPIYPTLEACLARHRPELVIIASPIHRHCAQACLALAHGCHVLCEKPAAATPDQVSQMTAACDAAGRILAIGYQRCYTRAAQALKADIIAGRFGAPRRLRGMVLTARDESYYRRNDWAGMRHTPQGDPVFDSPVNNACAHTLQEMLWLLGPSVGDTADVQSVEAELYRANPTIDNYDTGVLRIAAGGASLMFAVSHAVGPRAHRQDIVYEFAHAAVIPTGDDRESFGYEARLDDGSTVAYREADFDPCRKLRDVAEAIRGGDAVPCAIGAASAHVACVAAAQHAAPITPIGADEVEVLGEPGQRQWSVRGLPEVLERCATGWRLPSELGAPWARAGRLVRVNA